MNTLLIQIVIAAGIFLAGLATGIKYHAGLDAIAAQELAKAQAQERQAKAQQIDTAAVKLEKAKETVRTEFVTIERVVDRVIESNPVYLRECFTADGMLELNNSIRARPAASQPAPAVPASGPAR